MDRVVKIKHTLEQTTTLGGIQMEPDTWYEIVDDAGLRTAQNDSKVKQYIFSGDCTISNGTVELLDQAAYDWLMGNIEKHVHVTGEPPFGDKTLPDGSKLFKRLHGTTTMMSIGINEVNFTIPYAHAKMTGARITNGEPGDWCSFFVLDSENGDYTGIPNQVLNQYGSEVAIAPSNHIEECKYDADLYYGMQIQFVYNSESAKKTGINFNMSEVVAPS